MGLENKLEDIHWGLKIPLCECCLHAQHHVVDAEKPEQPSMTCRVLGEIPDMLRECRTYECEKFEVDKGNFAVYKPFLPEGIIQV